jgi:hypothetical protein
MSMPPRRSPDLASSAGAAPASGSAAGAGAAMTSKPKLMIAQRMVVWTFMIGGYVWLVFKRDIGMLVDCRWG